ncbi:G2/M phase-specific E3 ubiquitin-protein ligase-like isoform X2 [Gymnodraco acuticeps]|uniref:G2/M phase-specific E3 ubiquitin-protein ligase-like isoform X2 n=1 Tax=Gymnodraco acuticeps TaxID=8218 RepID=A0A6P8VEC1_GYMAC|nr:G2/M phase-specific E3 ubiquitin-protein ligase-like isoform X2 [Gymnodraco acuticeps]
MVETEGRSFLRCDWLRRSSGAGSCSELLISNQHNMMEGDESRRLQQALGVLRNILSTPETVTSLSSSLERQRTGSQAQEQHVSHSAVESELREPFRPANSQVASAGQADEGGQTGGSLRYQTQLHFGKWNSRPRKRAKTVYHETFNKDIILLPGPSSTAVIKLRTKQQLHEQGHILNGFEFQKSWDHRTVTDQIRDAFGEKLSADVSSRMATGCLVPVRDILQDLATKINHQKKCKFNINRSTVLDGAIRGFKRGTYDPCHTISVRFSDDMGVPEEAVDLGGPRREFLRLLMEALPKSPMFEGEEGKLNLAFDSTALREDRYFIAGRAIAVSNGGSPAGFLSPTLFSCLVDGPELAKPVLEDVADIDLHEKIKRVTEGKSLEDLLATTEPLEEYLANAGCVRPLRRLEDKNLLVDDILMFQVIHRVHGPFESSRGNTEAEDNSRLCHWSQYCSTN